MADDFIVRPAVPADAPAILGLILKLAAFEDEKATVRLTEERILADAFGPVRRIEVLVAEANRDVAGLIVLIPTYASWQGAPALLVHDLFVEPSARRKGAGRALLETAAKLAVERGCCRLDVTVMAWNEKARRFYESLGFTALPQWLPYRLDDAKLAALAGKAGR